MIVKRVNYVDEPHYRTTNFNLLRTIDGKCSETHQDTSQRGYIYWKGSEQVNPTEELGIHADLSCMLSLLSLRIAVNRRRQKLRRKRKFHQTYKSSRFSKFLIFVFTLHKYSKNRSTFRADQS